MADDEPELDAEGRPRHNDPRDNQVPLDTGKKHWMPWLIAAVAIVIVVVVVMGP